MARVEDRVNETSTTTGTGDFTLDGAVTQYRSFNAAFGLNVWFSYVIKGQTGSEWEVGEGYLSASTTLVRGEVSRSSSSDALVNFSAGTKDVFCTAIGHDISGKGTAQAIRMGLAMQ